MALLRIPFLLPIDGNFHDGFDEVAFRRQGGVGIVRKEDGEVSGRGRHPEGDRIGEEGIIRLGIVRRLYLFAGSGSTPTHFLSAGNGQLDVDVLLMRLEKDSRPSSSGTAVHHEVHPLSVDFVFPFLERREIAGPEIFESRRETGMDLRIKVGIVQMVENHNILREKTDLCGSYVSQLE